MASQADPGPFETYTVPAATWAVFSGEGTGRSIQALEKRIVTEWLPGSGYEYADGPDIEVYLEPDPVHTRYEVWVAGDPADGMTAGRPGVEEVG